MFRRDEREDQHRDHDQGRGGHDLSVGHVIAFHEGDRHGGRGFRGLGGEDVGEEQLVPREDEGEDGGHRHAGHGEGEADGAEDAPLGCAFEQRGLVQFAGDGAELVGADPDDDGEGESQIHQDQREVGVAQADFAADEEYGEGEDHGRDEAVGDEPEPLSVISYQLSVISRRLLFSPSPHFPTSPPPHFIIQALRFVLCNGRGL